MCVYCKLNAIKNISFFNNLYVCNPGQKHKIRSMCNYKQRNNNKQVKMYLVTDMLKAISFQQIICVSSVTDNTSDDLKMIKLSKIINNNKQTQESSTLCVLLKENHGYSRSKKKIIRLPTVVQQLASAGSNKESYNHNSS